MHTVPIYWPLTFVVMFDICSTMINARVLPASAPASPLRKDHKMSSGRGWFWGVRSLYFLYFRRLNPPFGLQLSEESSVYFQQWGAAKGREGVNKWGQSIFNS
jgi:hypothetical protein